MKLKIIILLCGIVQLINAQTFIFDRLEMNELMVITIKDTVIRNANNSEENYFRSMRWFIPNEIIVTGEKIDYTFILDSVSGNDRTYLDDLVPNIVAEKISDTINFIDNRNDKILYRGIINADEMIFENFRVSYENHSQTSSVGKSYYSYEYIGIDSLVAQLDSPEDTVKSYHWKYFHKKVNSNEIKGKTPQWIKYYGSKGFDGIVNLTTDKSGNIYAVGMFSDTINLDSTTTKHQYIATGKTDGLLFKLSSSGAVLWSRVIHGNGNEMCTDISINENGIIYIVGNYSDSTNLDFGVPVNIFHPSGVFSMMMDTMNYLYGVMVAPINGDIRVISGASGNSYIAGSYSGTADFNPSMGSYKQVSNGESDCYVAKYNILGQFVWAKTFGGNQYDGIYDMVLDKHENIITIGTFENTVDFNPNTGIYNLSSKGGQEAFVQKLDSSGNFIWAHSFGGTSSDLGYGLAIDSKDNIYATGVFQWTVDFDPGPEVHNLIGESVDGFVVKLTNQGNYLWARQFGGSKNEIDQVYAAAVDQYDNVYITGDFSDTVDFNLGSQVYKMGAKGEGDAFTVKLDSAGNFVWANSVGSNKSDQGWALTIDKYGNVYNAGMYSDYFMGGDTSENHFSDFYIQKLSGCSLLSSISLASCGSFELNGISYFKSGEYHQYLSSTNGCDSIIKINLTINSLSQSYISVTSCSNYISPSGKNWNITGVYFDTIPNSLGCDSIIRVDLTITCNTLVNSENNKSISLYPNPTQGEFTIQMNKEYNDVILEITNITGQKIFYQKFAFLDKFIYKIVGDNGIYFLKISTLTGKSDVYKILKY